MTSADQGAVPPSAGPSLSRRERFTRWLGKASFWKTLGAVATSVVAISTAIVAIATFRVSSQTLQADALQQASDRFDKAIEHLGSGSRDVRLGGIYALEKLARDTPSEHSQVYDVLTSYVRGHAVVGKDMCADLGSASGVVPSSPAPTSPAPSPLAAPPSPRPELSGFDRPTPRRGHSNSDLSCGPARSQVRRSERIGRSFRTRAEKGGQLSSRNGSGLFRRKHELRRFTKCEFWPRKT